MQRLYQDYNFDVPEVTGATVESLIGLVDVDEVDVGFCPMVIFLQLSATGGWHRFFLDHHWGVWESCTDEDVEECISCMEDEAVVVDYAEKVGGLPQRILSATASNAIADSTIITLAFESGAIMKMVMDSNDFDSSHHVEFS